MFFLDVEKFSVMSPENQSIAILYIGICILSGIRNHDFLLFPKMDTMTFVPYCCQVLLECGQKFVATFSANLSGQTLIMFQYLAISRPGLPDFSWRNIPKLGKIPQNS
jgi:hypothetical protein